MATKPNLIRKKNNVYWTPTSTPESKRIPANVDRRTGEVIGAIMPWDSEDNATSWREVMLEIGRECPDRTRRRGRTRQ